MKRLIISSLIILALAIPCLAMRRSGSRLAAQVTLEGGYEVIGDGSTTVTTAGTEVRLSTTSTPITLVTVCASPDSRGVFAVGSSTVVAAAGSTRSGVILASSDCIDVRADNLRSVYVDSTISGEQVNWIYYEYVPGTIE